MGDKNRHFWSTSDKNALGKKLNFSLRREEGGIIKWTCINDFEAVASKEPNWVAKVGGGVWIDRTLQSHVVPVCVQFSSGVY